LKPKLTTAERIRFVTRVGNCFDQRFDKHLCVEPKADKKAIFTAASKASEAVTFLSGLQGA
jgi:hypothetical protein